MPKQYYNYQESKIDFKDCDGYELKKSLGRGKYSEVYLGYDSINDKKIVVKLLKPVRKEKISREIRIL